MWFGLFNIKKYPKKKILMLSLLEITKTKLFYYKKKTLNTRVCYILTVHFKCGVCLLLATFLPQLFQPTLRGHCPGPQDPETVNFIVTNKDQMI